MNRVHIDCAHEKSHEKKFLHADTKVLGKCLLEPGHDTLQLTALPLQDIASQCIWGRGIEPATKQRHNEYVYPCCSSAIALRQPHPEVGLERVAFDDLRTARRTMVVTATGSEHAQPNLVELHERNAFCFFFNHLFTGIEK